MIDRNTVSSSDNNWREVARIHKDHIEIDSGIGDEITTRIIKMRHHIEDKAVRQWLINEGWTPPQEEGWPV